MAKPASKSSKKTKPPATKAGSSAPAAKAGVKPSPGKGAAAAAKKPAAKASAPASVTKPAKPPASAPPAGKASKQAVKAVAAKPTGGKSGPATVASARPVSEIIVASEAIPFQLVVLGTSGTTTYAEGADEIRVAPPTWFAVVPEVAPQRRYLHLLQRAHGSEHIVLLALIDGSGATRMPPTPGWQRAIVDGTVSLIASDLLLSRGDLIALGGGHEPPPDEAKPPFT